MRSEESQEAGTTVAADETRDAARQFPEGWTRRIHRGSKGDRCVYCGEMPQRPEATMDHLFADNLFIVLPDNVLTVPACKPCNKRKEPGDHVLRDYVTFHVDRNRTSDLDDHLEIIIRATKRRQSPLGGAASRAIEIRKQVDPFRRGGSLPVEMGENGPPLMDTLAMMVRGLFFVGTGKVLPPSCPAEAKLLTREQGEKWLESLTQSPELWFGEQGGGACAWMMFTSPSDPHSVLCLMSIDGVYFAGATGNFLSDDETKAESASARD